ncbi:dTMP kinase [Aquipuribacter hungaricus]|uniref:dTMP kinase n=1 Tax=Aquipuribacter hungaricus TaxID=545624 RepID=UPI003611281E
MSQDPPVPEPGRDADQAPVDLPGAGRARGATTVQPGPAPAAPDAGDGPDHSARAVLANDAFRRLWLVLGLSSLGDWLGLLAVTFFAAELAGGAGDLPAASLAVSGVFLLRLAPALLLGPLAGVLADRMDRRTALVVFDVVRGLLFLSIPLVGTLGWLYVATVLVEVAALFWMPAKDAMVPNLVPRRQLETANQLGVVATYGSAPLAALLFSGLVLLSGVLDDLSGGFAAAVVNEVDLALYANGVTFLVAAAVIARIRLPEAARGPALRPSVTDGRGGTAAHPSVWRQVVDGWAFIARTPVVRGLALGMLGAFAAGGFVIGLGVVYVAGLGAGAPGYGVLFGAVFVGMALGVWQGPRTLRDMSRRRLFAASIAAAGAALVVVGLSPDIVLSAVAVLVLGGFAGMAWVTGTTLLGAEVDDEVRGRTFAFVQTSVRVVLVAVMALAPLLARLVGDRSVTWTSTLVWTFSGAGLVMAGAGVLALVVGAVTFRQLDDRPGVRLGTEVLEAVRRGAGDPFDVPRPHAGFFLVVEGGDGAGKSTLAEGVRGWLESELGHDVVHTREPGGTAVGAQVRRLVLDWDDAVQGPGPVPRAEALLFAADRAQHVATVVEPALADGAVVLSDRYVDSSVAYQGARGDLAPEEVARLSRWATDGLRPDLTVLLDVDPVLARGRLDGRDGPAGADRVERAGTAFHEQVRSSFLELAALDPRRYLVVDATLSRADVLDLVTARLRRMLPLSAVQRAECERRLAEDARARAGREPAAVEQARQEQAAREEARAQQAQERERRWAAERLAAGSELRRHRAQLEQEESRSERTAVLPAVGAGAVPGDRSGASPPAAISPVAGAGAATGVASGATAVGAAAPAGAAEADRPVVDDDDGSDGRDVWATGSSVWDGRSAQELYAPPSHQVQPWDAPHEDAAPGHGGPDGDEGYPGYGYTDQGYADQGFADQGFADQGFAEQGHVDQYSDGYAQEPVDAATAPLPAPGGADRHGPGDSTTVDLTVADLRDAVRRGDADVDGSSHAGGADEAGDADDTGTVSDDGTVRGGATRWLPGRDG